VLIGGFSQGGVVGPCHIPHRLETVDYEVQAINFTPEDRHLDPDTLHAEFATRNPDPRNANFDTRSPKFGTLRRNPKT